MSNKKIGSDFEREIAEYFANKGYWAMVIPTDRQGQPCDVVVARNNKVMFFECKTCSTQYFTLDRIEPNQSMAMFLLNVYGNKNTFFVFKHKEKIYIEYSRKVFKADRNINVTQLPLLEFMF